MVTQRPAELDPTILSQCNTIFSMRLTNERDQEILRAGISDAAASLLEFMPTMGTGEAITFGEGVALPTRIKFDMLPADSWPKSNTASFTKSWAKDMPDDNFLHDIVIRWRAQSHNPDGILPEAAMAPAVALQPPPAAPAAVTVGAPIAAASLRRPTVTTSPAAGFAPAPATRGPAPPSPQAGAPGQQQSLASLIRQFRG